MPDAPLMSRPPVPQEPGPQESGPQEPEDQSVRSGDAPAGTQSDTLPQSTVRLAARSSMAARFNLFFRFFANRYFKHFSLDDAVVERLRALEARGSVVYVMRYSSRLDYFLFNALFLRHGLRLSGFANAIHFYYYRPLLQFLPLWLRIKRARPREVEHSEDREIVSDHVAAGKSLFLFLRTQRLLAFLKRRKGV